MASSVSLIVTASWAGVVGVDVLGVPGVGRARCIIAGEQTQGEPYSVEN